LQNATNTAKWHALNRTKHWNDIRQDTNWDLTHKFLNYNNKPNTHTTYPKHSQLKSFKIKFLLDELPTLLNLHYRKPITYTNPTCNRCTTHIENNSHWLECTANPTSLNQVIQQTTSKFFTKNKIELQNISTLLQQLFQTSNNITTFSDYKAWSQTTYPQLATSIQTCLLLYFIKYQINIYKQIWTERCKAMHQNSLLTNTLTITTSEHPATDQAAATKYKK